MAVTIKVNLISIDEVIPTDALASNEPIQHLTVQTIGHEAEVFVLTGALADISALTVPGTATLTLSQP